jgi:hypothetical protein
MSARGHDPYAERHTRLRGREFTYEVPSRFSSGEPVARKRRSRTKETGIAGTLMGVAIFFLLAGNWVPCIFLAIAAVSWWLGFEVETTCDVETVRGTACGNTAHGFLRACRAQRRHRQIKRAILLSYLGMKRPISRIVWARNSGSTRSVGALPAALNSVGQEMVLTHPVRETVTFVATVVSTGVTVAAFVFQVMSSTGLGV